MCFARQRSAFKRLAEDWQLRATWSRHTRWWHWTGRSSTQTTSPSSHCTWCRATVGRRHGLEVRSKVKLMANRATHEFSIVETLREALPDGVKIAVLTDRGFGDIKFYQYLEDLGLGTGDPVPRRHQHHAWRGKEACEALASRKRSRTETGRRAGDGRQALRPIRGRHHAKYEGGLVPSATDIKSPVRRDRILFLGALLCSRSWVRGKNGRDSSGC